MADNLGSKEVKELYPIWEGLQKKMGELESEPGLNAAELSSVRKEIRGLESRVGGYMVFDDYGAKISSSAYDSLGKRPFSG